MAWILINKISWSILKITSLPGSRLYWRADNHLVEDLIYKLRILINKIIWIHSQDDQYFWIQIPWHLWRLVLQFALGAGTHLVEDLFYNLRILINKIIRFHPQDDLYLWVRILWRPWGWFFNLYWRAGTHLVEDLFYKLQILINKIIRIHPRDDQWYWNQNPLAPLRLVL